MDSVIRAVATYLFLLLIFRIAGKRTLAQATTFDFVLLLIISEVVQQAMIANDNSMLNATLLVITLVGLDIGLSIWKHHSATLSKLVDGAPVVLIQDGKLLKSRMEQERVDEAGILARARELQGLERLEEIKYAVLETSGGITIVPTEAAKK